MLKLGHMVDDKMHARSIGPYSLDYSATTWVVKLSLVVKDLVRWRFGHLKVMVLATFYKKCLTVKSDDVVGRAKAYEAIVKGSPMPTPGIPESFNVLMHELLGLGLKVTLD